jgi:Cu(I)/Ag(I) efflux system membrane fusion protein
VVGEQPGQYAAVDVELGRESGGRIVVKKGLQAGQQVVASGQFLIDSEASVAGAMGRNSPAAPVQHEVDAVVEAVEGKEITLQHGPVPALKWPAMSMPFALKSPQQAAGLKAGDRVRIAFIEGGSGPVVERIVKRPAAGASR